jgi:3-deoxy-D-manno-octulosonate 8-phosphate phosphatase (KDO 8-P phosphatase)
MIKIHKSDIKKIKVIVTDVDGVLNDGKRFYSKNSEPMKCFHVRDGMAINILKRNKIPTVILTKETSDIVSNWAKIMNVSLLLMGVQKKETVLPKICRKFNVSKSEIAYIGDDVNDVALLNLIGLSVCPKDASIQVKKIVNYICKTNSGNGVLREITELILNSKFGNKVVWY